MAKDKYLYQMMEQLFGKYFDSSVGELHPDMKSLFSEKTTGSVQDTEGNMFIKKGDTLVKVYTDDNENVQTFPYDKATTIWGGTVVAFRYMVDGTNGDDANDGLTWVTAKKTILAAVSLIPPDLKGAFFVILIHPGDYLEESLFMKVMNGIIRFIWVGEFINTADTTYAAWVRNGAVNPIRNSNQVVLKTKGSWTFSGKDYEIQFNQVDHSKSFNAAGFCYWDRFVVSRASSGEGGNSAQMLIEIQGGGFGHDGGFTVDGTNVGGNIGLILGVGASLYCNALKVIGGDTGSAQATGSARGVFWSWNNLPILTLKKATIGFATGFAPVSGKQWEIINFKTLVSVGAGGGSNVMNIDFPTNAIHYDAGVTGLTKPIINLGSGASGTISYNSDQVTLVDASVNPRTIKDYVTNITKQYLSNKLINVGDVVLQKVKNAVPADTVLSNEEASFYLDQTTNKLMVKVKYSDGTVKSGSVSLT